MSGWRDIKGADRIEPDEAMRLVNQHGVRTEVGIGGGMFSDGDILMRFYLPDGREIMYRAVQESDYYGGHYDEIEWWLSRSEPDA